MRSSAVSAGDRAPRSHAWLAYDEQDDFLDHGLAFLTEGVARDDHLLYVSPRPLDRMRSEVAVAAPLEGALASGGLTLVPYDATTGVHPEDQVAFFADLTERAVRDGRHGLRVLADLTGFAAAGHGHHLLRYEHLADRFIAGQPMVALCAADRRVAPESVLDGLEALHPGLLGRAATGFRLLPEDDGLRLTGVVDSWDAERLAEVLAAVAAPPADLYLHLDGADHISARGLAVLHRHDAHLRERGGRLRVVGARSVVGRACSVLGLDLGRSA